MIAFVWAVLLAGNVPVPAPSSSALKTIVTVRSSVFCDALRQGVAPVLRGLIRDDTLIALGRSAYASMNRETTYGGYLQSSYNQQGAAQVVVSPGLLGFLSIASGKSLRHSSITSRRSKRCSTTRSAFPTAYRSPSNHRSPR